jgi:biopolymer transport protein ExbD
MLVMEISQCNLFVQFKYANKNWQIICIDTSQKKNYNKYVKILNIIKHQGNSGRNYNEIPLYSG